MGRPLALYYGVLGYDAENRALLERVFRVRELPDPRADTDELLGTTEVLFAPLGFVVDRAKLDRCPRLRVVASNTTGIPHIDAAEAARRGISVCALHDEQEFLETITPTAEHTIGLMLAAWRRIPAAQAAALSGRWDRRPWGAPKMLSRMSLGLVGYGRLGRRVGAIAAAMGMQVRWYDPNVPGGEPALEALAAHSEVLSLHAPATEATRGLVSRRILRALPKGALVVNTARGELLDGDALVDLLESGHLGAAALDTIEGEYAPGFGEAFASSRLATFARRNSNLVITPHIGGSTRDAWHETERRVIVKACAALDIEVPGA